MGYHFPTPTPKRSFNLEVYEEMEKFHLSLYFASLTDSLGAILGKLFVHVTQNAQIPLENPFYSTFDKSIYSQKSKIR